MDAIYLRISRDRAGTELGVDRQREDCRQLATPGAREFMDNDTSASAGGPRPGYKALMEAVVAGEVKRIIVWTTGRLWRNRRERAEGIETLKTARAQVTPFKGPALDCSTAAGRALVGLLGELDTWETDTMTERLQREARQRAEDGKPHGGPRAYGYTADGMALVPDEAAALARWYAEFLAGRSLSSIAREAGKTHATIRWILRNPRNAALRVHDGHVYPARWPAVVTHEVWLAADTILKDPGRRRNTRNVAKKWIGSGVFLCARCNGRPVMSAWTTQAKRVYRCIPSMGGCSRSWRADRLDEFITSAVAGRLRDPGLAALLPKPEHANELPDLYVERKALKSRLESLASTWALGELTDEQLRIATATAKAKLEDVEAKISLATATDPVLDLLREEKPAEVWLAIPEDQVERRQRIVRGLATVVLGASPPGRAPWSPGLVLGGSRWLGDTHTWAALYVDGRE